MILLWGVPGDDPLDVVWVALCRRGADARLLDQRSATEAVVTLNRRAGTIAAGDLTIDLLEVGAAYIRPQESIDRGRIPDSALVAWADLTDAAVVNRPAAMAANNSKPYQLALIARYGFDVPDTIVTTDPNEAHRFRRRHGRVVYKSVSGVRSIVAQLRDEHLGRFADLANGPTQFQEWIPGHDVRVHVVGDEVLATIIRSDADDYRYASSSGTELELAETALPSDIAVRCRKAARGMGLHVAGIDLRRTPGGRWVCFEVNPSPAFTFYEAATGQPIGETVADLLVRLDRRRQGRRSSTAPRVAQA